MFILLDASYLKTLASWQLAAYRSSPTVGLSRIQYHIDATVIITM
jgi:hypothetical protein